MSKAQAVAHEAKVHTVVILSVVAVGVPTACPDAALRDRVFTHPVEEVEQCEARIVALGGRVRGRSRSFIHARNKYQRGRRCGRSAT